MKNLIIELRLDDSLDISTENNNRDVTVVRALLDKLHLNVVNFIRYTDATGIAEEDTNNTRTLLNNETVVYVKLSVEPDNDTFYKDNYNLLKYIADALDFRPAHVSGYFEREDGNYLQTIIEITVGEVKDGIAVI